MPCRTSALWALPSSEFAALVAQARTFTEVLAHFGLPNRGHNHRTLRRRLDEVRAHPIEARLRKGTPSPNSYFRHRLVRQGLLPERCALCGIGSFWQGKPLTLQLDHINGDRTDNRLENLRLLCPNCHSQTETFAGRKPRRVAEPKRHSCARCGDACSLGSQHCTTCHAYIRRTVERPDHDVLQQQVDTLGYSATGRLYGVSDKAIRKWLRKTT